MSLIFCFLFNCIVLGWACLFRQLLNTNIAVSLFNAIAFLSCVMFYSFLLQVPQFTAILLLLSGGFLAIYFAADNSDWPTISCFFILTAISLAISHDLKFRSIDDYAFWGSISKYLFTFNRLPTNADYIQHNFLTYVPGLASFHYLLYSLAARYSQTYGYFAQGLILTAAMLIFFDPKDLSRSLLRLGIWIVLFTLSYGTIFARMEVDAYVAAYLLSIAWLIYTKPSQGTLVVLPIIFLSLIKEVAVLFSVLALILVYVQAKKTKTSAIIPCIITSLGVIGTRIWWLFHTYNFGFHSFAHSISLSSALAAFNPGNSYYHQAQTLFLHAFLFDHFDYLLKVPYILIYLGIAYLGYWLIKKSNMDAVSIRNFLICFGIGAVCYLALLYLLEAIVFAVGHENGKILAFHRYFNMLLLPLLSLLVFISLENIKLQNNYMLLTPSISLALIFLFTGKIERINHFYNPHQLHALYNILRSKTASFTKPDWSICLLNPPQPEHQLLLPLTYFFMPHQVYIASNLPKFKACDLSVSWDLTEETTIKITTGQKNIYNKTMSGLPTKT